VSPALFLLVSLGMAISAVVERPRDSAIGLTLLAGGGTLSWAARRRVKVAP
jgi:hypothetical protein